MYIPVNFQAAKSKCVISSCTNSAKPDSVYCSEQCIVKHAEESLVALEQEKQMRFGSTKVVCTYILLRLLLLMRALIRNLQNATLVKEPVEEDWLDQF